MPAASPLLTRLSAAALLLAAAFVAPPAVGTAQAAAPMVRTSAPGYHRMMLGDFEITALSDGTVALPLDKLLVMPPEQLQQALARSFLTNPVETSVNGYLVNTGSKLVLIDTGAASLFGPTLGKLADNLRAAGYQPEQVDEVYITHLHPDHIGGLMNGDKLAFPNAVVRADKADADFWLSPAQMEKAPADAKGFFQGAMASLNPYVSVGRFKPFSGDTPLVPGVRAAASHGHTAGHSTYVVESKGEKLVLLGDILHAAAVQFDDPSVVIRFDTDNAAAAAERQKAFADAANGGYWIAAAHLAFPGIGHLRAEGKGYRFVPVNYGVVNPPAK